MIRFQDTVETTKNILLNPECFHFASSVRSPSGEDEDAYLRLSEDADYLEFATAEECLVFIEERLELFASRDGVFKDFEGARILVREDEGEREGFFELVWSCPEEFLIFTLSTEGRPVEDAIGEFESVGFVRE